ncbi:transglutaminaseTgpA domain-containing protein [Amycolatopsis sp. lyj-108]|uniref:transglutaminase family protein n=1 Tax=Amycolatopsis sp. lyj-108 TaxID=2789286 RepID=UPI00397B3C11
MNRLTAALILLAAMVAGLFFAPVFGVTALLIPIGVPLILAFGVTELCSRWESLVPWRALLLLIVGLAGVAETVLYSTTASGFPTGATFSALADGVTESWRLALQSTWPARPEPSGLLFVPLLVLLAGVLGVELLKLRRPILALLPSFAVVVVSQLFQAMSGFPALFCGLGYAAVAGGVFVLMPQADAEGHRGKVPALALAAPAFVLGVAGALVANLLVPAPGPAYSLKQDQLAELDARVASPLDDLAYRLEHPGTPVFSFRGDADTDRWPLVVLDDFDGVNWTPGSRYRRLGTELAPGPAVAVPTHRRSATITTSGLTGPWLPSQTWPAAVGGIAPLVEESQGTLWLPRPGDGRQQYTLSWWSPEIHPADLLDAALDSSAPGGLAGIGDVPPEVGQLAREAVGGLRPSFRTALALERFLRERYRLATGADLPAGHSWPQLRKFLFESKLGTSEQFASAYVALARTLAIPARLVVGFRTPDKADAGGGYTVRNGDAVAWPEVAVSGVGWVALDPTGAARTGTGSANSLAAVTAEARTQLPPAEQLQDRPLPGSDTGPGEGGTGDGGWTFPFGPVLIALAALLVAWFAGVPLAKGARAWRRRRQPGIGAVLGACREVKDRLREHRVPCTAGMTVRDLAAAAHGTGDQSTVDGLLLLASTVDVALWSGVGTGPHSGPQAWAAVREVRRGLARRGLRARLHAAVNPRTLVPTRS